MARPGNDLGLDQSRRRLVPISWSIEAYSFAHDHVFGEKADACPRCEVNASLYDMNLLCCQVRNLVNDPRPESRKATALYRMRTSRISLEKYQAMLSGIQKFNRNRRRDDMWRDEA